jgi:hypothetical protein
MHKYFNNSNVSSNVSSNAVVVSQPNIISYRKQDNCADFKYICIKKEFYDINMIYLNYKNVKKDKYIEIIYKSPSIFLEGLFFKTPIINASQIRTVYKDKHNYSYITIKITLDSNIEKQAEFINMLNKTDEYINNYIMRFARDINKEFLNKEANIGNGSGSGSGSGDLINNFDMDTTTIEMFRYDNILKHRGGTNWELNMKSYLDKTALDMLSANTNAKYIFTFNITNIYLGNSNLIPLIKCNKCEPV